MKLITNISENKRNYNRSDMKFGVQGKGYEINRIPNIEVLKERKNKVDPEDSSVTKMGQRNGIFQGFLGESIKIGVISFVWFQNG